MASSAAQLLPAPDVAVRPLSASDYQVVRAETERLCEPLETDDYNIQSMSDVSPPKWHLAHTTWFFENFVLAPFAPGYARFHAEFGYLFNSYYQSVGAFHPRVQRALSRPTVAQVYEYRKHVDSHVRELLIRAEGAARHEVHARIELGLHHEQQHQELLLTDIKHIFASNPLRPAYHRAPQRQESLQALRFFDFTGGLKQIGHDGEGFGYDNEMPRHPVYVAACELASRLVSNGEFLRFIEAGGYRDPRYWLSEGWNVVNERGWKAPLYWERDEKGVWQIMTLAGMTAIDEAEPVCHVSYFEADAYARWAGKRLPTEAEWELAAQDAPVQGNFRESGRLHPQPAAKSEGPAQLFGDVWEWTQSPYSAYPGYQPAPGPLGEYNGKFMCNQFVLRGGSCVTPRSHIRATYRNFFTAADRWQFTGIRLAQDRPAKDCQDSRAHIP